MGLLTAYSPTRLGDYIKTEEGERLYLTSLFPHHNILVSAVWFLKGKKARETCASKTLREVMGARGGFLADSGAFSYYRKQIEPPDVETVAEVYTLMGAEVGFHLDIPVAFISCAAGQQKLFEPAPPRPPSTAKLLRKNLRQVEECRNVFRRRISGFQLIPVAQGMVPNDYGAQVRALAAEGHDPIALGGLAFRGSGTLRQILAVASQAALGAGVALHTLGVGRLGLLQAHIWSGAIRSMDTYGPGDDAHRDSAGISTYLYALSDLGGSKLLKLRLDKLRSGEIKRPDCSCPACKLFGHEIILAGSKPRNVGRAFHNLEIFQRYVGLRFAPERSPSSEHRSCDLRPFL